MEEKKTLSEDITGMTEETAGKGNAGMTEEMAEKSVTEMTKETAGKRIVEIKEAPAEKGAFETEQEAESESFWEEPEAVVLHPQRERQQQEFLFFGIGCAIYACLYTFCRYHNAAGITAPFLTAGTLVFCFLSLKRVGLSIQKDAALYAVFIMLLGIHLCTTGDRFLITFDWIGIILLLVSGMLHQIYEDREWGLGGYGRAILKTIFGALEYLLTPFTDFGVYHKDAEKKNGITGYILIGIGCGIPVVIIVLLLLNSADVMFGQMLSSVFSGAKTPEHEVSILLMTVAAFSSFTAD